MYFCFNGHLLSLDGFWLPTRLPSSLMPSRVLRGETASHSSLGNVSPHCDYPRQMISTGRSYCSSGPERRATTVASVPFSIPKPCPPHNEGKTTTAKQQNKTNPKQKNFKQSLEAYSGLRLNLDIQVLFCVHEYFSIYFPFFSTFLIEIYLTFYIVWFKVYTTCWFDTFIYILQWLSVWY